MPRISIEPGNSSPGVGLKSRYRNLGAMAGVILLALLLVTPSFYAFAKMKGAAQARKQTYEVLLTAGDWMSALSEAETGQRGYVLTGDETFLEPFEAVRGGAQGRLRDLRRLASGGAAPQHLDAMVPMVEAKLLEMSRVIDLRRNGRTQAAVAAVGTGEGKRLMEALRAELKAFLLLEEQALARNEAGFQANMGNLLAVMAIIGLFTLLIALSFIYVLRQQAKQKLQDLVHFETRNLLERQEELSKRLQKLNTNLLESREQLGVTLNSIGDAVIATDTEARIRLMNPVAEQLTGWTRTEAEGRLVDEVFHIINQETRQPGVIPVTDTLKLGTIHGLANHTLLIARDGSECAIADSCAPIRAHDQAVIGAVLVFRDVTQEYAVQQTLRDSSALIQTVLNTVADGIITIQAAGGIIEKVNQSAERMFGYSAAELVGQRFSLLIPELGRDGTSGSLDYYKASEEDRASGLGRQVEGLRKDGSHFPLEIATSEMSLGGQRYFTGLLRDISARKQAEEALLQAGALQAAIFNSANFSSIATDAQGVIQIFNVGAERMLGYTALEVMNKITPADISDPGEVIARAKALSAELETPIKPGFEALVFKASRGIEDIYELTYIRKDGSRFPAVVSVTALRDPQNVIIGYLLIGTDNTARLMVEAERSLLDAALKERNVELLSARIAADKANLAKSEFLSSMSHELRSPLNAILGFAQLMDSSTPPATPPQKASIDRILHAGWYLLELINEILDLAVIESGKLSISEEPVSLAEVLVDCKSIIEPQSQKRGIRLFFPAFPVPLFVHADRVRLKQVLINLLSNAIKYNRPGGTVVVVCTSTPHGRVRIGVKDTGHGLSPEQLRQLFQPFNRLGQERSSEEGTGIGLVMSKLLVELMHGAIGVDSTVGGGSEFWFDLNVATAPALIGPDNRYLGEPEAPAPKVPLVRTVLYIEDNPANMELVEQLIGRRPDLFMLGAGDAALGLVLARNREPDVILMDINLPGLSGIEALKLLREDPATEHIPVIAISANAMMGDVKKGLEAGFFRYLTKPINVVEFMETIDLALEIPGPALIESK
ncbi:MAG: PAS domain S-box protein [Holophagaceae bacterium]|uniref:histidine kinase n=1 Tax=Candidatus Geothrix skivensis TaxID=2954439 RepID=A0A9D7SJN4_9BACT|nr:PAS domain S-box protein [Candidatus Geothrix skivensis]